MDNVALQIAFANSSVGPIVSDQALPLPTGIASIYAHSYLGSGWESAYPVYLIFLNGVHPSNPLLDPCAITGAVFVWNAYTVHGTGNYTLCKQLITQAFATSTCPIQPCALNGQYQPPFPSGQFVAASGDLTGLSAAVGCEGTTNFGCIDRNAALLCANGSAWAPRVTPTPSLECFASAYLVAAVAPALGVSPQQPVIFASAVSGTNLTWPLAVAADMAGLLLPHCHIPTTVLPYAALIAAQDQGSQVVWYNVSSNFVITEIARSPIITPALAVVANTSSLAVTAQYLRSLVVAAVALVPDAAQANTTVLFRGGDSVRLLSPALRRRTIAAMEVLLATASVSPFPTAVVSAAVLAAEEELGYGWQQSTPNTSYAVLGLSEAGPYITIPALNRTNPVVAHTWTVIANATEIPVYLWDYSSSFGIPSLYNSYLTGLLAHSTANATVPSACFPSAATVPWQGATITGTGGYAACKATWQSLLGTNVSCGTSPCAMAGVYQPTLLPTAAIQLEQLYYTVSQIFNCVSHTNTMTVGCVDSVADVFCTQSWAQFQAAFPSAPVNACLYAAMMTVVLQDGHNLSATQTVTVFNATGDQWFIPAVTAGLGLQGGPCPINATSNLPLQNCSNTMNPLVGYGVVGSMPVTSFSNASFVAAVSTAGLVQASCVVVTATFPGSTQVVWQFLQMPFIDEYAVWLNLQRNCSDVLAPLGYDCSTLKREVLSGGSLNPGAIIGIVVGTFVGLVAVGLTFCVASQFLQNRREKNVVDLPPASPNTTLRDAPGLKALVGIFSTHEKSPPQTATAPPPEPKAVPSQPPVPMYQTPVSKAMPIDPRSSNEATEF